MGALWRITPPKGETDCSLLHDALLPLWDFVTGCDENNLAQTSFNTPFCPGAILACRRGTLD
jgi:hypothetical protein